MRGSGRGKRREGGSDVTGVRRVSMEINRVRESDMARREGKKT